MSLFWMLIDTMFARDCIYQVYEINDYWFFITFIHLSSVYMCAQDF